ncbi:MAG: ferritin-like domain-containing protein [Alphaproteobacteria bacterium]|nr:ferritin-like domain-containing protein [Alphaproteobacteria bacterium]
MTTKQTTLAGAAKAVLLTANAEEKARKSLEYAALWNCGTITTTGVAGAPDRPARPNQPQLLEPQSVPRRKINRGTTGRIALLHALSHIELNAVDLAWDIILRFMDADLPRAFFGDWVQVAAEEAKHFGLLTNRLADFGAAYGDLPAHDGLWDAAIETKHDLVARLAIVPLVLEARGLDVTPLMINKLRAVDDDISAEILETIYRDEIGHVRIGKRWFAFECERRQQDPKALWRQLVTRHFRGDLKPPFNIDARNQAELPEGWYTNFGDTK